MHNKLNKTILLIVAAAIGLMSTRLLFTLFPQKEAKIDTSPGISYLHQVEDENFSSDKTTMPKETQSKKANKGAKNKQKTTKSQSTAAIKNGNLRAAYKDFIISGDSLVKSIYEYGILDSETVIAEIGVGTSYLKETTDKIIKAKPKYLVLHYGENELDEKENAVYFINRYKKCIKELQKELPETEIFVDGIFPVLEKAYEDEPYTVNIDYYNSLIKDMAKELGVKFIDFSPLFKSFDKEYYDADGIHLLASFYKEQYLPYVYTEVLSKN